MKRHPVADAPVIISVAIVGTTPTPTGGIDHSDGEGIARSVRSDRSVGSDRSRRRDRSPRSELSRRTPFSPRGRGESSRDDTYTFSDRVEGLRRKVRGGYLLSVSELAELEAADAQADAMRRQNLPQVEGSSRRKSPRVTREDVKVLHGPSSHEALSSASSPAPPMPSRSPAPPPPSQAPTKSAVSGSRHEADLQPIGRLAPPEVQRFAGTTTDAHEVLPSVPYGKSSPTQPTAGRPSCSATGISPPSASGLIAHPTPVHQPPQRADLLPQLSVADPSHPPVTSLPSLTSPIVPPVPAAHKSSSGPPPPPPQRAPLRATAPAPAVSSTAQAAVTRPAVESLELASTGLGPAAGEQQRPVSTLERRLAERRAARERENLLAGQPSD
jgi:hypothetical protein